MPLKSGHGIAEGDLDFRGTLGIDKEAPVGFAEIRLKFEVDTDAHAAQLLDARARLLAPARALGPAPDLVTLRRPASAGAGPR